jgi:outer membrane protein assembly factor BamB
MPNGDSLNYPSQYYSLQVPQGQASRQGMAVLPYPNNANKYYIFHFTPTDTLLNAGGYEALNLYYSLIDMTLDSGRGDLTAKNIPIIQDELLSASRIAACQHANGRDWWIVKPAWHENIYYELLLTPNGIQGPFVQQIGPLYSTENEIPAYSIFSQDGSKYASVTAESYVVVMNFDRCSGLFSNPDSFYNNDSDPGSSPLSGGNSLAFSPSGRFLYVDNPTELNQYDLWSLPIHDSVRIETDTEVYQMNILQLAPNGKIYISCWNGGSYAMHVINQPDSLGLACDFQLFGQPTRTQSPVALPYFPNYRLGAVIGSACDTISAIQSIAAAHPAFASVTPNPAKDHAEIIYYTGSATSDQAMLYDVDGKKVWSAATSGSAGSIHMDISAFATGMYFVRFTADGTALLNTKLVIVR